MWTAIVSTIALSAVVFFSFGAFFYVTQPRLVYFPLADYDATPDQIGMAYENVFFTTADGVKLSGWFIPAENAKEVLLFFHGNAGNISHRLESLAIFHQLGLSCFIIDYRGYGKSEGTPSEKGTYLDAEAAWKYLTENKGFMPSQILIFGRSLGGAVAAWLAERYKARACILESTFTSAPDMAKEMFPFFPARLFCRYSYNALEAVENASCPKLIIHSSQDDIVPFAHGRRLYDAARKPKYFLEISGDHNSGFLVSGEEYTEGLADFLNTVLKE